MNPKSGGGIRPPKGRDRTLEVGREELLRYLGDLQLQPSAPSGCRKGAASGYRKWVPPVGAASGCRKWLPQVGTASGYRKWVPQVGAASGCRKWVPQGCCKWMPGAGHRRLGLPRKCIENFGRCQLKRDTAGNTPVNLMCFFLKRLFMYLMTQ